MDEQEVDLEPVVNELTDNQREEFAELIRVICAYVEKNELSGYDMADMLERIAGLIREANPGTMISFTFGAPDADGVNRSPLNYSKRLPFTLYSESEEGVYEFEEWAEATPEYKHIEALQKKIYHYYGIEDTDRAHDLELQRLNAIIEAVEIFEKRAASSGIYIERSARLPQLSKSGASLPIADLQIVPTDYDVEGALQHLCETGRATEASQLVDAFFARFTEDYEDQREMLREKIQYWRSLR